MAVLAMSTLASLTVRGCPTPARFSNRKPCVRQSDPQLTQPQSHSHTINAVTRLVQVRVRGRAAGAFDDGDARQISRALQPQHSVDRQAREQLLVVAHNLRAERCARNVEQILLELSRVETVIHCGRARASEREITACVCVCVCVCVRVRAVKQRTCRIGQRRQRDLCRRANASDDQLRVQVLWPARQS